jgi:hypothetical protein
MTRIRIASLFVALVFGATALEAQPPTKQKKTSTPQQDSAKALKREIKSDKIDRKKAKAAGDTARVKALTKDIKTSDKARKKLKGKDTTSKKDAKKPDARKPTAPPPKKP